ncbi:MAG: 2-amino-4-hydroxy-6-hydroxymethyldihydropteridine diphosphokinase [Pseudomonadota bacterium]|nr:2-amino-4-hydroxy-6-hydroxymethyldihydropteridine diphosphokinase [Pseudomonadota bacterium]
MPRVYLGIGSNVAREANIAGALESLRECFAPLTVSPVYESKAVGFDGPSFHNLVAGFDTDLDLLALHGELSEVEHRHGRRPETPRYAPRPLDLDILLYGNRVFRTNGIEVPRRDILEYAFVLRPLADIAPDLRHPANGRRIADLWQAFDQTAQPLWPIPLARR